MIYLPISEELLAHSKLGFRFVCVLVLSFAFELTSFFSRITISSNARLRYSVVKVQTQSKLYWSYLLFISCKFRFYIYARSCDYLFPHSESLLLKAAFKSYIRRFPHRHFLSYNFKTVCQHFFLSFTNRYICKIEF